MFINLNRNNLIKIKNKIFYTNYISKIEQVYADKNKNAFPVLA